MDQRRHKHAIIVLAISAVVAPFVFFSSPMQSWQSNRTLFTLVQEIVYPFEYGWFNVRRSFTDGWDSYIDLRDAESENAVLRKKLALMQTRIVDYEEQMVENRRLRRLLGFATRYDKHLLAAEVIGNNQGSPFRSIRINRGSQEGVQVGMPVVTADGIVGRIIRVGQFYADVQLLVDGDFYADVLLQRTRVRGVLSGGAHGHCKLQLHRRVEIRIGDTLITSGIVGSFPKGLPVGRVMRITYESDNVAQSVTVEPWVDHRRLEEVMVLFTRDEELVKIVESAGPEWLDSSINDASGG